MTKHKPRTFRIGSFTHKLAMLAVGESMLHDVPDRQAFNRKRDHAKLALKVPSMAAMRFEYSLYHCSDLSKPATNCLIMRITRLEDQASPKEPHHETP